MGISYIILACFLWALDALVRYPLVNAGSSALAIVFTEHIILTIVFIIILRKQLARLFQVKLSTLVYFFIVGGLGSALATLCFTRAFNYLNPSIVIILQKFQPIFVVLLARLFLKEKISSKFILWSGVALSSALLISFEDLLVFTQQDTKGLWNDSAIMGYTFTFVAVCLWGSATVFGKKLSLLGHSETQIMGGRFAIGALVLLFLGGAQQLGSDFSLVFLGKIAILAFISGLLGMYFYYKGLKKVSARVASMGELFFPFCAVIVNWLFLSQTLTNYQILGGVLLMISSTIIEVKKY